MNRYSVFCIEENYWLVQSDLYPRFFDVLFLFTVQRERERAIIWVGAETPTMNHAISVHEHKTQALCRDKVIDTQLIWLLASSEATAIPAALLRELIEDAGRQATSEVASKSSQAVHFEFWVLLTWTVSRAERHFNTWTIFAFRFNDRRGGCEPSCQPSSFLRGRWFVCSIRHFHMWLRGVRQS